MARETRKRKQPKRKDQEKTRPEGEGQRQEGGEKAKDEPAPFEENAGC